MEDQNRKPNQQDSSQKDQSRKGPQDFNKGSKPDLEKSWAEDQDEDQEKTRKSA